MMRLRTGQFSLDWSIVIWFVLLSVIVSMNSGKIWSAPSGRVSTKIQGHSPFKGGGRVYNTSHYSIVYDTSKAAAQKMAEQLENLKGVFFEVFKQDFELQVPKQRMNIYLFKTEEEIRQYVSGRIPHMLDYFGLYDLPTKTLIILDPQGSARYQKVAEDLEVLEHRLEETRRRIEFHEQRLTGRAPGSSERGQQWLSEQKKEFHEGQERKLRLALNLKIKAFEKFFVVTLHEGTHQLRDFTGLWLVSPLWLEEGMAEYFSVVEYGKGSAKIGKKNKRALKAFKNAHSKGSLISLRKLLTWGVANPVSQHIVDKEEMLTAYSEFWALFYFFLHGDRGKWREPFISYIRDLRRNPPSPDNDIEHLGRFQKMLSSDLASFEQRWIKTVLAW